MVIRVKLTELFSLHLGKGRISQDVSERQLPSDMLSAALASIRASWGASEDIAAFLDSFAISSAFPYDGDEYFMPRPNGLLNISVRGQEEKKYRKKLKSLRYISFSLWKKLINGEKLEIEEAQLHGEFLSETAAPAYRLPWTRVVNQRVSVPREEGQDAEPYMFEWTYFKKGAGLYCFVEAEEALIPEIKKLFTVLGGLGIGSDRTVGGGQFNAEFESVSMPSVNGNATMMLSSYIPTEDEVSLLNLPDANYSISKRGGFIAGSTNESLRHLRRKPVYMFDTGSVFPTTEKLKGEIVNVRPDWNDQSMHSVFRSGKPFCITINRVENE